MSDLSGLLERVRKASGPDRRIDSEIACALVFANHRPAEPNDFEGKYGYSPGNIKCNQGFLMADSYTSSIDAAVALVERVLPSLDGQRRVRAERLIEQTMRNAGRDLAAGDQDIGGKAARGLCLAILTALADPADDAALLSALDTGSGR